MIQIELAHVQGGNLYILAALPPDLMIGDAALLEHAGQTYDLSRNMRRFARRDRQSPNQLSYALLIAKPIADPADAAMLIGQEWFLTVATASGDPLQSSLRLQTQPDAFRQLVALHESVLRILLEQAGRGEAYLLETDVWPEAAEREEVFELTELSASLHFEIDFCCIPAPNILVIVGFLLDPLNEITAIDLFRGDDDIPLERRLTRFAQSHRTAPIPERNVLHRNGGSGFLIVAECAEASVPNDDFVLLLATKRRLWTKSLRARARLERGVDVLASHMVGLDADTRLLILEGVAEMAGPRGDIAAGLRLMAMQVAAVADLPPKLSCPEIGLRLTVDLAAHIAGHGVFLLGWAQLEPELLRHVMLCIPTPTGLECSDIATDWVQHRRWDVWQALKDEGASPASDQLGFISVVRLPAIGAPGSPHVGTAYLAVHLVDDSLLRMKLQVHVPSYDPVDAVKPLLTAFPQHHLQLADLLNRHIGPAVAAAWAQRRQAPRSP